MQYITSRCGKCGNTIRSFSRTTSKDMELFGVPFDRCPHCNTILLNGHKEYIMMKKGDKFKYHLPTMFFSIPLGAIIGIIAGQLLFSDESMIKMMALLGIILMELLLYWRCEVNFNDQKEKSINRIKDKEYLDILLKLNLISNQKYDETISSYY